MTMTNKLYNFVQKFVQFTCLGVILHLTIFTLYMLYNLLYNFVQLMNNLVHNCTICTDCTRLCTIL